MAPRPTTSTRETARILGVSTRRVREWLRDPTHPLAGYPLHTPSGGVYAWRVYTDTITTVQEASCRAS